MKKVVALAFFSMLAAGLFPINHAIAQEVGGALKIGYDFEGEHEVSGYGLSGTEDVEAGVSLSGELHFHLNNYTDLGFGITYQIPRSQDDYQGDFNFVPVYGLLRAKLTDSDVAPYFIGHLGYNFFDGDSDYKGTGIYEADLEGGLYWGLGGGVLINKHLLIEMMYSVNNGTVEELGYEFDIEYSKWTLSVGYNF